MEPEVRETEDDEETDIFGHREVYKYDPPRQDLIHWREEELVNEWVIIFIAGAVITACGLIISGALNELIINT